MKIAIPLILSALGLSACAGQLDHLGKPPTMSPPGADRMALPGPVQARMAVPPKSQGIGFPQANPGGMATPSGAGVAHASLWRSGPASLFGDHRARTVGDILTVLIEIDDNAQIKNKTTRARTGNESLSLPNILGIETLAPKILPGGAGLEPAVSTTSSSGSSGDGSVARNEKIKLRIAATVTYNLANGHLVIQGSQEVRVNFELRNLQIAGIIRPEDISRQNTITYDKIADARISYGGRGQISDLQQPRYGQQVLDMVLPF